MQIMASNQDSTMRKMRKRKTGQQCQWCRHWMVGFLIKMLEKAMVAVKYVEVEVPKLVGMIQTQLFLTFILSFLNIFGWSLSEKRPRILFSSAPRRMWWVRLRMMPTPKHRRWWWWKHKVPWCEETWPGTSFFMKHQKLMKQIFRLVRRGLSRPNKLDLLSIELLLEDKLGQFKEKADISKWGFLNTSPRTDLEQVHHDVIKLTTGVLTSKETTAKRFFVPTSRIWALLTSKRCWYPNHVQ